MLRCAYSHDMDFHALREALRRARNQTPHTRKGVQKLGLTLDEAAAASGINRSTIHAIENVKREPALKPELETIEALVLAYRSKLSVFFRRIEDDGLSEAETIDENTPPPAPPQVADDDALQFESEERITQAVVRRLARFALKGIESSSRERQADYRLSPEARPLAAESSLHARKSRPRHVPVPKKNRPKK